MGCDSIMVNKMTRLQENKLKKMELIFIEIEVPVEVRVKYVVQLVW